jgi:hypothetical protein
MQPHPLQPLNLDINPVTTIAGRSETECIGLLVFFAKDPDGLLASWWVDDFTGRAGHSGMRRFVGGVVSRVGNLSLGVSASSSHELQSDETV